MKTVLKNYTKIPNSNGMKVLRDTLNLETGESIDVVIRNVTEDFWKKVIETTKTHRVCALGSPGIGKSTSTCILIRHLLQSPPPQQQETIIYHVRTIEKINFVFMFTRTSEGSVDVKVIQEKDFNILDENINQPSTYYIVDPGQTKDDCNPPTNFQGKVIIVASPDAGHWGGSNFLKRRRVNGSGTFLVYTGWKLLELLYSSPYMKSNLTDEEIESRYEKVGGIPRSIFTNEKTFADTLKSQETAVRALTDHQVKLLALGNEALTQTFLSGEPKSVLMTYECSDPKFEDYSVTVSSRRVTRLLVERHIAYW